MEADWFYGTYRFVQTQRPEVALVSFMNKYHFEPGEILVLSAGAEKEPGDTEAVGFIRFAYYSKGRLDL